MPVTDVEIDEQASADSGRVVVHVRDSDHDALSATFHLRFNADGQPVTVGVSVMPQHDAPVAPLTVTQLRELPLARWERSARAQALLSLLNREGPLADPSFAHDPAQPGRKLSTRALEARAKLTGIAREYRENLAGGLPDPVAEIARSHSVKPSTARAWVHRARQAGLLGAAPGRTAGERAPADHDQPATRSTVKKGTRR